MKKIMLTLALLLIVGSLAFGQKVFYGDTHKPAWNAVPPISTGDVIEYEVWLRPGLTGTPVLLAVVPNPAYTVSLQPFLGSTRYFVGVRTKRTTDEGQTVLYSTYVWSNSTNVVAVPVPFVLQRPATDPPAAVTGLVLVP